MIVCCRMFALIVTVRAAAVQAVGLYLTDDNSQLVEFTGLFIGPSLSYQTILPRDDMLARYVASSCVCPSVCHKSLFC